MFLAEQDLRDLTGRCRPSAQARWLRRHGYRFETDADGAIKVLKSVVEKRLGGADHHQRKTPQLRLAR